MGAIYIPRDGTGQPKYKQYVSGGFPYQDIWAYQPYTNGTLYGTNEGIDEDVRWLERGQERLGYPTQKPIGLLERIVSASSNEGDVVLDPFCGCGTAIAAAERLKQALDWHRHNPHRHHPDTPPPARRIQGRAEALRGAGPAPRRCQRPGPRHRQRELRALPVRVVGAGLGGRPPGPRTGRRAPTPALTATSTSSTTTAARPSG